MSVGTMLVEARSAMGMSVADVSSATRIRPAVVEAIERDDFSLCGGDAYAKGQLRSIARVVGLDPEVVIGAFEGRSGQVEAPPEPPAGRRARRRAEPARPRVPEQVMVSATPEPSGVGRTEGLAALKTSDRRGRSFNWTAAMLVAILALVTVGVISVLTRGSSSSGDEQAAPPPAATTSSAPAPTPTTEMPTASPTPTDDTVAQASQVEVTVTVTGDKSWLSVTEGKSTSLFEDLVEYGDTETFTSDKTLKVVVGNAGAVTISVNGQDLGSPGAIGEVRRMEFSPDDPTLA